MTYFKVVLPFNFDSYASACARDYDEWRKEVIYKVGEWVECPHPKRPLAIFDNEYDANNFITNNYLSGRVIFSCHIGQIIEEAIFYSTLPHPNVFDLLCKNDLEDDSLFMTSKETIYLPKGTIFTNKIKLLEKRPFIY